MNTHRPHDLARLILLSELAARVTGALSEAGVRSVALKGLALTGPVFAFGRRDMRDVDLLVARGDAGRAAGVLRGAGLRPLPDRGTPLRRRARPSWGWYDVRRCQLDLHLSLGRPPLTAPDEGGILRRAVPHTIGAAGALRPCNEDLLLTLALDRAKDLFARKAHAAGDVGALVGALPLDWTAVVSRARRWRCTTALWLALRHAVRRGEAEVPGEVLAALAPGRRRGLLLEEHLRLSDPAGPIPPYLDAPGWRALIGLATADRLRDAGVYATRFGATRLADRLLQRWDRRWDRRWGRRPKGTGAERATGS